MKRKIALVSAIALFLVGGYLFFGYFFKVNTQKIELQKSAGEKADMENDVPEAVSENNDNILAESSPIQETEKKEADSSKTDPDYDGLASQNKDKTTDKSTDSPFKITDHLVSWGHESASSRKIDTIIIHSTYNATGGDPFSFAKILDIYKSYGVSPHYILSRDGKTYRLVKDTNIAFHAGEGKTPDGRSNVNSFSIGIEVINSKSEGPSGAQYDSLKRLVSSLKSKHSIKYVLGHSDISPGRKDDPWKFDWGKLR